MTKVSNGSSTIVRHMLFHSELNADMWAEGVRMGVKRDGECAVHVRKHARCVKVDGLRIEVWVVVVREVKR